MHEDMHKDWRKIAKDLTRLMAEVRGEVPGATKGFSQLAGAALTPGALDTKTKELIAVGISIAIRCDGCVAFHVKAAVKQGASREEMLETIATAIYMGGGPSFVYGAQALEAYDQFTSDT
jgi:AhpD family alkylhydroperoxidase